MSKAAVWAVMMVEDAQEGCEEMGVCLICKDVGTSSHLSALVGSFR